MNARFQAHTDPHVAEMLDRYSVRDPEGTRIWLETLNENVNELFSSWGIVNYRVNADSYMGIVLECDSSKYGETIVKMYPPFLKDLSEQYSKETYVYQTLENYHQCGFLDYDPGKHAMLLQRVSPGSYISYPRDADDIMRLFKDLEKNKLPISAIRNLHPAVQNILHQIREDYIASRGFEFYPKLMEYLKNKAEEVHGEIFSTEEKYLLHGDVYFKNALRSQDGIQVIDPRGFQDAYVFEYTPFFALELAFHSNPRNYLEDSKNLIKFFQKFADTSKLYPAVFIYLVSSMIQAIHGGNDQFKLANIRLTLIRALFLDEEDKFTLEKTTW